jgi:DNA/RNA-binding domain of Phe-tRNA-synthetase-like protein
MSAEPQVVDAFVADDIRAEFPELSLACTYVDAEDRKSRHEVRERLQLAADRFTGAKAVVMRQQPIPAAYRVFFRHVGIDPDERRTPIEAIAVERMRAGGFPSRGLIADALLLATLDTSVPVQAFDADRLEGSLRLRTGRDEEFVGDVPLRGGEIVIADERRPVAVLFGDCDRAKEVGRSTRRVALAAVGVAGVPRVSVEEALWTAVDTLSQGGQ